MTVHGSWTINRLVDAHTHHQRRTRGLRPQTLRLPRLVRPDARPGRSRRGPDRPRPPDAGRRGGVHHVVAAPVLPRVDVDRAVIVAVVLPIPARRGILRRRTRSGSPDRCPLAACDAASFPDRAAGRASARVVRRLGPVRATGSGNRAVPGDLGAAARRGRRPVSGRHRLARRHPADTRPKEPSRRRAAAAPRGGAAAGRLSERGASGDRRTPRVRRAPGRSSRQAALERRRLTCRGARGSPGGSRRAARGRQRLPAHRSQPHGAGESQPQRGSGSSTPRSSRTPSPAANLGGLVMSGSGSV